MNTWAKIGLSALGAAAVVGIYFGDEYYTKKEEEEKKITSKAVPFETQNVRRLVMTNQDGQFVFERDNATTDWKMIQPKAAKPDQDAVNNLLSAVQSLNVDSEVPDTEKVLQMSGADAEKYGLTKPRYSFEIRTDDSKEHKLFIGDDVKVGTESGGNFIATSVYAVNPAKKGLLIVNSSITAAAKKNFGEFRTKLIGDFSAGDVKSFELARNNGVVISIKKDDKDWKIVTPKETLADNNNVGLYLDKMSKLRAEKVTEQNEITEQKLVDMGLKPASATLTVKDGDKQLQKMEMGLTKDKIYITMSDGAIGAVDVGQWQDIAPDFNYFRDRRVMRDVGMNDVLKVRTQLANTYQKEGNNWYLTGQSNSTAAMAAASPAAGAATAAPDAAQKAANQDAARLVSDWEFLTADEIIDGPEAENLALYGLDNPSQRFTFEFTADSKKPPEEILVGKKLAKDEKKVYIKRASKPAIFVVETTWLESLKKLDEKPEGPSATKDTTPPK